MDVEVVSFALWRKIGMEKGWKLFTDGMRDGWLWWLWWLWMCYGHDLSGCTVRRDKSSMEYGFLYASRRIRMGIK